MAKQSFFCNQQTTAEDKVGPASFPMTKDVQLWFFNLFKENQDFFWECFKGLCYLLFGPPTRSNPLGELITLTNWDGRRIHEQLSEFACVGPPLCVLTNFFKPDRTSPIKKLKIQKIKKPGSTGFLPVQSVRIGSGSNRFRATLRISTPANFLVQSVQQTGPIQFK